MTDLPFVSALVQADLPVWEQCLQTEFLQKMENGTQQSSHKTVFAKVP